jgi:hypothetical protein
MRKQQMEGMQSAGAALGIREKMQAMQDADNLRKAMGMVTLGQVNPMSQAMSAAPSLSPTNANVGAVGQAAASAPTPGMFERLNSIADQLEQQAVTLKSPAVAQQALKYREEAQKYAPQYDGTETLMQGGKPVVVQKYKNRAAQTLPDYQPKPDYKSFNNGQVTGFVDPLSGQVGPTFNMQATPGELLSNDIARQNVAIGNQRLGIEGARLGIERQNQDIKRVEVDPLGFLGINKNGAAFNNGTNVDYSSTLSPQERAAAEADARRSGYTQGASPTGAIAQGVSGDALLATLPKQLGDQVKALAEGRMSFPGSFALKSPYWQGMISLVSQYDPSFDAINYAARSKTRNDFTAGKSAQQANALNTVIGHLGQLSDAADALNNTSIPIVNRATNFVEAQMGDPRIKQFDITRKAVVDELTRVYRGTGGSEKDIQTWTDAINSANSPAQLHGAIAQVSGLLESKIQAMEDQYQKGMGTTADGLRLLTAHARESLDKMGKRAGGSDSGSGPVKISGDTDYAQLPSGTEFVGPDGVRRRKP